METLLLSVILQGIITIFLLNAVQYKNRDSFYLTALLLSFISHLGYKAFLWFTSGNYELYNQVHGSFSFLYGPLLFLYASNHAGRIFIDPRSFKKNYLHFIPFFVALLYNLLIVYQSIVLKDIRGIQQYEMISKIGICLSTALYAFVILQKFAFSKRYHDQPLKRSIILSVVFVLLIPATTVLISQFTELPKGYGRSLWYGGIFIMMNVVLYLKIKIYKKELAIQKEKVDEKETTKSYQTSVLKADTKTGIKEKLHKAMEQDKLFLDSELTLESLAKKLQISKHHITEVLNIDLHTNFYSYINKLRVEEAIKLIRNSDEDILLIEICFNCGFKSKSTFNKYFKETTGITPKEFRQNNKLIPC